MGVYVSSVEALVRGAIVLAVHVYIYILYIERAIRGEMLHLCYERAFLFTVVFLGTHPYSFKARSISVSDAGCLHLSSSGNNVC